VPRVNSRTARRTPREFYFPTHPRSNAVAFPQVWNCAEGLGPEGEFTRGYTRAAPALFRNLVEFS
jgi:hypothetical protein